MWLITSILLCGFDTSSCPNFSIDSVDEDKMLATGISRFCEEAGLDPTSSAVLILAWKFKAATQCEFTRAEFVGRMTELGYIIIM